MKKTLLFAFIVLSISSCVVFISKPEKTQENPNSKAADTFGALPEVFTPAEYATVRPDQQPEQDYPNASNWEFYSQKNGTPLRRANADSIGKMFRPDIAALDTTDINRFLVHNDSAFYKNFYGDSMYIGWTGYTGGENIYTANGTILDSVDRRVIVDTAASLHFAFDSVSDGGIIFYGINEDGNAVTISSANKLNYITISESALDVVGPTVSLGDSNQDNYGLGLQFFEQDFTLGSIFSDNNFGFYGSVDNRTAQMFSQADGNTASGRVTVDSTMSIISFDAEDLGGIQNEIGFRWNYGPGIWTQINGAAANYGDILRAADDGLMYYYQLDTAGVNIYNSNGTIPPDSGREINLDTNTTVRFQYPNGAAIIEMYSGTDGAATDGYVGLKTPTESNILSIDDASGIYIMSESGVSIGDIENGLHGGVGVDVFSNGSQYQVKIGNVYGNNDRFVSYDAENEGAFLVQNEFSYIDMDVSSNITLGYGDFSGGGTFLVTTENGAASAKIEQDLTGLIISADDGNDLSYQITASQAIGRVQLSGYTTANASAAIVATADDSGNGKSSSVVLSISDPDAVVLNSAAIEIDTNGVKIQTIDGTGANGNVLKSNGLYTYWADAAEILWDSTGVGFFAHDQDERRAIYQNSDEFQAYGYAPNGQYGYVLAGDASGSGRTYMEGFSRDNQLTSIFSATVQGSSNALIETVDSSATYIRNYIEVDTNGIEIFTRGSNGSAGDILQSNGAETRWGGAGTFNADVLSFTPGGSASAWVAVPANRSTLAGFATVASISPAESVTEILIDTASTTSTVNLNYTPDTRLDNPFTTVRYIYNWGSGNALVQTNQSWLFKTSATTSGTLTIASGEAYKLIWLSNATPANARFYCIKIQ